MKKLCPVCNRQLKSKRSIALGIGPVCKKKADQETIAKLRAKGMDGQVIREGVQLTIPTSEVASAL